MYLKSVKPMKNKYNVSPEVVFEVLIISTCHHFVLVFFTIIKLVFPLLFLRLNLILCSFLFFCFLDFGGLDLGVFLTLEICGILSVILLKIGVEFLFRLESLPYKVLILFNRELFNKAIFLVRDSSSLHVTGLEKVSSPGKINSYR